jgi:tetratricopeptide (TPR) repeat protein
MARSQGTLYDVLGVARDASDKEIRAAFRKLALDQHPDLFQGSERERAERRFQEITEAFNVLRNRESRDKYDQDLSTGTETSKGMDPAEIARRLAAKGAQLLRDGKPTEALEHLDLAIAHDDDCGRAHYFKGKALSQLPGRAREGLRHLEKAAQLEPNNHTINAEAAEAFLAVGMSTKASRLAQQALSIDPTNERANEVMRRLEAPEEPEKDGGGLLGRLRRKG